MSYNTFPTLQGVGWPIKVTPRFKTVVQEAASGATFTTSLMASPLFDVEIPVNFLTQADYQTLQNFFVQQLGGAVPFYITPQQASWTASQLPFGTWNGTATSAGLVDSRGNPISSATVTAIHRTDWQGRQLLYPTARTNEYPASGTLASTSGLNGATITSGAASPSAGINAFTFTASSSAFGCVARAYLSLPAGPASESWVIKAGTAAYAGLRMCGAASFNVGNNYNFVNLSTLAVNNSGLPAYPITAVALPGGYILLTQTGIVPASDAGVVDIAITDSSGNTDVTTLGGQTLIICAPEYEFAPVVGAYIPTGTLTDYTLAGTTVNLGQAPGATATTDWDGTGSNAETYLVRFAADTQDFSQIMYQIYETKTIKLRGYR